MKFRMKVEDVFVIGPKTIFVGQLEASEAVIADAPCTLQVEGQPAVTVMIKGEVQNNTAHRDLWTDEPVKIDRAQLTTRETWLIGN